MDLKTMTNTVATSNVNEQSAIQSLDKATAKVAPQERPQATQEVSKAQEQGIDSTSERAQREIDKHKSELIALYTQLEINKAARDKVNVDIGKLKRLKWKEMNKRAFAENKNKLSRLEEELKKWNRRIDEKVRDIKVVEGSIKTLETIVKVSSSPPVKGEDQTSKTTSEVKPEVRPTPERNAGEKSKDAPIAAVDKTDEYLEKAKVYDGQGNADLKDKPVETDEDDEAQKLSDEEEEDVVIYTGGYDDPAYGKKEKPHETEDEKLELGEEEKAIVEKVGLGIAAKGSFNDEGKTVYEDMVKVMDIITMTASFGSKTSYIERYAAIGAPILKSGEDVSNLHNQLVNSQDAQVRGFKRTWKMILVGARFLLFMQQQKCLLNAKTVEEFKATFSGSERQVKLIQAQTLESVSEAVRLVCCIFSTSDRMFVRVPLTPRVVQAHQEYGTEDFLMGTSYAYVKVPKTMIVSQEITGSVPH